MPQKKKTPEKPKETLPQRRCKYCSIAFTPPNTTNGKRKRFCSPTHQKAYWRAGKLPFPKLVEKTAIETQKALWPKICEEIERGQRKAFLDEVRQIAREEIRNAMQTPS